MNTTLIEQIKIMESREGQLQDPRLTLDAAEDEQARGHLTEGTPDEEPRADVYEPGGIFENITPDIIEMVRAMPASAT